MIKNKLNENKVLKSCLKIEQIIEGAMKQGKISRPGGKATGLSTGFGDALTLVLPGLALQQMLRITVS